MSMARRELKNIRRSGDIRYIPEQADGERVSGMERVGRKNGNGERRMVRARVEQVCPAMDGAQGRLMTGAVRLLSSRGLINLRNR